METCTTVGDGVFKFEFFVFKLGLVVDSGICVVRVVGKIVSGNSVGCAVTVSRGDMLIGTSVSNCEAVGAICVFISFDVDA